MSDNVLEGMSAKQRLAAAFNRLEAVYLKALRVAILILATLLIAGAVAVGVYSLYKISRSPDAVKEAPAIVEAAEIVNAQQVLPQQVENTGTPQVDPRYRAYYNDFIARYHRLFRNRFEPFRQPTDKQLSQTEFGDSYVRPSDRIEAIQQGNLDFETDKNDLEGMLRVMTAAAEHPTTQDRLKRYMNARKVRTCRTVQRTRLVSQQGWDRYSSACQGWYLEPIGCAVTRQVEQPYSAQECSMQFPPDTQSHAQIFRAFQDEYLALLSQRRAANAAEAEARRNEIVAGKEEGAGQLLTVLQILGAFLLLMFFFLLIAIERHLRRRAAAA